MDPYQCMKTKNCDRDCIASDGCKYLCYQIKVNRKFGKALLKRIYKLSGVCESLDYYIYTTKAYKGPAKDMINYLRGLSDQDLRKFIMMAKIVGG